MITNLLSAAWRYRNFVVTSIKNEYKSRLARSKFGMAWLVIRPLAEAAIYALVLSKVLAAKLQGVTNSYGYAMYLLAGIACWSLFSEVISRSTTVFVDQSSLLRRVNFPRITLPMTVVGSALVGNIFLVLIVAIVAAILGFPPSISWIMLPVLMILTAALAAGIGLFLGTIHVFSRDVGQIVGIVLQFWFWMTPIVYPASIVPERFKQVLAINPVTPLVQGYQNIILHGKFPGTDLIFTVVVAIAFMCLALFLFRRASSDLVDAL